jgi:hypothetical protein
MHVAMVISLYRRHAPDRPPFGTDARPPRGPTSRLVHDTEVGLNLLGESLVIRLSKQPRVFSMVLLHSVTTEVHGAEAFKMRLALDRPPSEPTQGLGLVLSRIALIVRDAKVVLSRGVSLDGRLDRQSLLE